MTSSAFERMGEDCMEERDWTKNNAVESRSRRNACFAVCGEGSGRGVDHEISTISEIGVSGASVMFICCFVFYLVTLPVPLHCRSDGGRRKWTEAKCLRLDVQNGSRIRHSSILLQCDEQHSDFGLPLPKVRQYHHHRQLQSSIESQEAKYHDGSRNV